MRFRKTTKLSSPEAAELVAVTRGAMESVPLAELSATLGATEAAQWTAAPSIAGAEAALCTAVAEAALSSAAEAEAAPSAAEAEAGGWIVTLTICLFSGSLLQL